MDDQELLSKIREMLHVCGKRTDWPTLVCGLAPGHPGGCYPAGMIQRSGVGDDATQ